MIGLLILRQIGGQTKTVFITKPIILTFFHDFRQGLKGLWWCALIVTVCILIAIAFPSASRVVRLGGWRAN